MHLHSPTSTLEDPFPDTQLLYHIKLDYYNIIVSRVI